MYGKKSKSLVKYSISDREILDKRIQPTSRYIKVQSKTDSGFNCSRRQETEREIRKYYKVRHDEVFRRISLGELLQLMVIYAEECNIAASFKLKDALPHEQTEDKNVPLKFKDEVDAVVHQMDDLNTTCKTENLCPFLILDVRPSCEFDKGHLTTAVSHPHTKLSRIVGWECKEMLSYKNHPDWIIVVCDENETLSPEVAATLIHRGYDNVFMLSGGLILAKDKFGSPLVTTDKDQNLSSAVVDFILEMLPSVLLPPLLMEAGAEWWKAKSTMSRQSGSDDACVEHSEPREGKDAVRGRSSSRSRNISGNQERKPWK